MKPKRIDTEARRISIGLVKDVLETMFEDNSEMEAATNVEHEHESDQENKRKLEELETVSHNTRPKRTKTKTQQSATGKHA